LADQETGLRSVYVAICEGQLAGYVTVLWTADDPAFRELGIPEISDLRVHPGFRRRGIGSALMDRAETEAASRFDRVGLNVGLHSGYGGAQRLYVRRGYLPDGSGVVLEGEVVSEGATIRLDDNPIVTLRMTKDLGPRG
jgi:GNAT superfamily N-acetyltransferase